MWDELPQYRGLVTLVDGSFDPLHPGHLQYFHKAAQFGPVLVNICSDMQTIGKHPICQPIQDRAAILDALACVRYVHVSKTTPTLEVLQQLQPKVYVKGDDWQDRLPTDQVRACAQMGTTIAYVKRTPHQSSTILSQLRQPQPDLDAFERLVLGQKPADKPWEPVIDYSLEARRKVEGRRPALIRDVLQPTMVLDAGCGRQGILVQLLHELHVSAMGFDPAITYPNTPLSCYPDSLTRPDMSRNACGPKPDVVICREVLEHLPIRDVYQAVKNLCGLTSRLVYVTTRFTRARHFLDFATSDDLDPTHISLMPQDWLRHLFTLEGFRRRADLEHQMDWQQNGRALVYERAA